ncbi:hypothetical protein Bwad006_22640 [Bilophila wadsworthia]
MRDYGKLRTVFPEQNAGTGAHMLATVPAAEGPDCRRCDGARRAACPPVMKAGVARWRHA